MILFLMPESYKINVQNRPVTATNAIAASIPQFIVSTITLDAPFLASSVVVMLYRLSFSAPPQASPFWPSHAVSQTLSFN